MVSPATAGASEKWFDKFWNKCQELGCRIDYLATHMYKGTPDERIEKLKAYSERYGNKKIWLTEFAVAYEHNVQNVIKFIEEFLPKLEFSDFIDRYSWFIARYAQKKFDTPVDETKDFWNDPYANSLLPPMNDNFLTAIGEAYDKPWHLEQYRPHGY